MVSKVKSFKTPKRLSSLCLSPMYRYFFTVSSSAILLGALAAPSAFGATSSTEPVLRREALTYQQQGNWLEAAHAWQQIEENYPATADAFKQRVFALSKAGAPFLAERLATEKPDQFTADERFELAHAAAAMTLNFGHARIAWGTGPKRFETTDQALDTERQIATQFGERNPTRFDRLLGLRERERMAEVVSQFEALSKEGVAIPPYVRIAAGDAYLALHQPERARDLLLPALAEADPRTELLDGQLALTYAFLEAGQPQPALDLIDKLLLNTPPLMYRRLAGIEQANPDYARVAVQAALLRIYTERLDDAERRLTALRTQAPFNNDVRMAWAILQNARDHRQAAREEFRLLQVDHPTLVDAVTGGAETLLAQNDVLQAQALMAPLYDLEPDNRSVRQFDKKLALYKAPSFKSDIVIGRGAAAAGAESVFDTSATSGMLGTIYNGELRALLHFARAQGALKASALTPAHDVERNRIGTGVSYRSPSLWLDAELNHAAGRAAATGVVVAGSAVLSDAWQTSVLVDTNVNTLAAAAFDAGITARQIQANMTWSANESRKAGFDVSLMRFSDGNLRPSVRLWWNERWISGPAFKFDTTATFAATRNQTITTPYFNPRSEQEISIAAKAEWLNWQRYEYHFKQKLTLQSGQYHQAGFASSAVADLHYEHDWALGEALTLNYGIGHSFHPYDGVREQRRYGYLTLNWRLK